ncbi:hypothetical protein [Nocardia sp. NPDC004604]|uniref:hypothetical protein n=1 Tax=Nocardia sp. NPDC004604 TaxID=3157013 RepID=UPI0033B0A1E2
MRRYSGWWDGHPGDLLPMPERDQVFEYAALAGGGPEPPVPVSSPRPISGWPAIWPKQRSTPIPMTPSSSPPTPRSSLAVPKSSQC